MKKWETHKTETTELTQELCLKEISEQELKKKDKKLCLKHKEDKNKLVIKKIENTRKERGSEERG